MPSNNYPKDEDASLEGMLPHSEEGFGTGEPQVATLFLEETREPPSVQVFYEVIERDAALSVMPPKEAPTRVPLLEVFNGFIVTYPINVRSDKPDYLQPKYNNITSVTLDWNEDGLPNSVEDVEDLLMGFPEGFSKQFEYGLGLKWEYRFLIEAIAEIDGVEHIVFSKTEITRVEGDTYLFNMTEYQNLRKGINRIARTYQNEARSDKMLLAYSNILRKHDPKKYPLKTKKLKPGSIYNIVNIGGATVSLDKSDQKSALKLIENHKEQLAKNQPKEMLKLKADIEHATLGQLISKFEEMVAKNLRESVWQAFFKDNSFVLSLAFSYPVALIQDQAHVGGADIRGIGGKITDFLVSNRFTGNMAVFEIKRPDSELLKKHEYRVNLYQPSAELSGSIAQVQDQKFQLQNNFVQTAYNSGWGDAHHAFAVHCVVIIGRSPKTVEEKKSFEFSRNALKDVQVFTFDELLEKLKLLHSIFDAGKKKSEELQTDLF